MRDENDLPVYFSLLLLIYCYDFLKILFIGYYEFKTEKDLFFSFEAEYF